MTKWLKTNQGIGTVMTLLFITLLIYIKTTTWSGRILRDGFILGFFPIAANILLIICSIILMVDNKRKNVPDRLEKLSFMQFMNSIWAFIFSLIYFKVMLSFGFIIASLFFLILSIYILGIRPWRRIITSAIVMTLIVYTIFSIMRINLPTLNFT